MVHSMPSIVLSLPSYKWMANGMVFMLFYVQFVMVLLVQLCPVSP